MPGLYNGIKGGHPAGIMLTSSAENLEKFKVGHVNSSSSSQVHCKVYKEYIIKLNAKYGLVITMQFDIVLKCANRISVVLNT